MQTLWLRADTPIYKHHLFWIAILAPACFSFFLAYPLMEGLKFETSLEAYELFSSRFKFPLSFLSLSLLFGVFVARMHFSLQRAESLKQTDSHNNFKMYFEHREFMKKEYDQCIFFVGKEIQTVPFPKVLETEFNTGNSTIVKISFEDFYKLLYPDNSPSKVESYPTLESVKQRISDFTALEVISTDGDAVVKFKDIRLRFTSIERATFTTSVGKITEQEILKVAEIFIFKLMVKFHKILSNRGEEEREQMLNKYHLNEQNPRLQRVKDFPKLELYINSESKLKNGTT